VNYSIFTYNNTRQLKTNKFLTSNNCYVDIFNQFNEETVHDEIKATWRQTCLWTLSKANCQKSRRF